MWRLRPKRRRTNQITTGERTRLFSRIVPDRGDVRWHDVDRINDTHIVVAGIAHDRVFIANTSSGLITWQWDAQNAYQLSAVGNYPDKWNHINDVESLDDGRIMVSMCNRDSVVFLTRQGRLQRNWTLGRIDDYNTLYEQHNPDYIPASNGGPAVLVADSQNDRIVEFQREGTRWKQTWVWQDSRLRWPRDADRLPNGNTLITDTNGDRVIEVDSGGELVWSVRVNKPYEAERLTTGDESTGGQSANATGLQSRDGTVSDGTEASLPVQLWFLLKATLPPKVLNGIMFVLPAWISPFNLVPLAGFAGTTILWSGSELYWRLKPVGRIVPTLSR